MHPTCLLARIPVLIASLTTAALAVPTAVDDTFTTPEDTAAGSSAVSLINASFDPAASGFSLPANWDYNDALLTAAAGGNNQYPVDADTNNWRSLAFDTATSTRGPWKTSAMPIQGGGVDGLPGAANLLGGITGASAVNTINGYLFRNKFTITAAQAGVSPNWDVSVLADDGCIVYLNGTEIGRGNWPGSVTVEPDALVGGNGGSETAYNLITFPASAFLDGENVFAVQLNQNTNNSSDAGIDFRLAPSATSGFVGVDDAFFGTARADFESQAYSATGGFNGTGSLRVQMGGVFAFGGGSAVSGAWRKNFTLAAPATVTLSFRYRIQSGQDYDAGEYQEVICDVDGTQYGTITAPSTHPSVALQVGNGNGGGAIDGGWQQRTFTIPLAAGAHILNLGGYANAGTFGGGGANESFQVDFDDVALLVPGSVSLLANDTGGVAPVTAVKAGDPGHGTVTVNADGSFSYQPEANFFGTDAFTYRAVDGTGESAPATVTINVTSVNDLPVAGNDGPYVTPQGTAITVPAGSGVLANDTDVELSALTAVMGTASPNGSTVLNTDGSFTFTPASTFAGTTTFTYRASDGTDFSVPATVTISVTDVPDSPVAAGENYTAVKNTALVVSALVPGSTTEEILPVKAADWHYFDSLVLAERNLGTAWRSTDYVEDANWKIGAAELGYGDGDEATTLNDNPNPAFDSAATDKFATYYFRRTVSIPDITSVTAIQLDALFDDGIVIFLNGTEIARNTGLVGQGAELAWDYYSGNASNNEQTAQAWTIPVASLPANLLQDGTNLIATEVHQTQATSSDISMDLRLRITRATAAGVLANDSDPDPGQTATLTVAVVDEPLHGSLTLNANGTFTYTPATGYTGPDLFTYRATDTTTLTSNVATVNITVVTGPNVAPIANPDAYTTAEDATLNVTAPANSVLANDTDAESDPFTAVVVTQPAHGALTMNTDGTFSYVPVANYNGIDTFTYRAVDTRGSTPATVTITVTAENDAPVAVNDSYSGDPGTPFSVSAAQGLLANDSDIDAGTTLTVELVTPPASGDLTLNPDGSFTFTVAAGGVYTFTYKTKDGTSESAPATVSIALNAVPLTQPDTASTGEDQTLTVSAAQGVLSNDSDPESQPLSAQLVVNVQHGTLTLNPDGSFTYQPSGNYFGSDTFTYRANDGTRISEPVTVTISVNAINDTPIAANDVYGVRIDTPLTLTASGGVLRNDTDVDDGSLTALLLSAPAEGSLTLNPDGSFTYTPATGFSGSTSFTYRASDGSAQSAAATVTLNVSAAQNTLSISEIMYNPPGTSGALEEFIEVYNYGDAAVDLTGWAFTKGVNYTFPDGTLIPGKGYLAIPASIASFQAKYPGVTAVTTTAWGPASSLGNGGEMVRLKNAADETVDEVDYADSGDWADRQIVNVWDATNTPGAAPSPVGTLDTDPGLEWHSTADPDLETGNPGGSSIQLVNAGLSNNAGQNWRASMPTPGAANTGVAQTDSAPLIRDVAHSPAVPNQTQQVYVTARIQDELPAGATASVFYRTWNRNANNPDSPDFTEVAMADNGLRGDGAAGDSVFGAVIPAQPLNKVVEFYVRAADAGSLARTWPAPTLDVSGANPVQNANCLYQVDEETWTDHRPLYQAVLTGADNNSWNAGRGDAQSNVAPNCTVIFRQGGQYSIRYRASIRTRGNSSRSDNPVNLRLDIPGDNAWNGRTAFTLNYKYSYSQFLASRLIECAGVPVEKAGIVGVRLNGQNRVLDSNGVRTFGYYCDLIPRGGDTIKEWFPGDDGGNAYGKIRAGFGGTRWAVSTLPTLHPVTGYAVGGYVNQGYWKQTNAAQNDWTDLDAWMQSLQLGATDGSDFHTFIANTVDIDQWCRLLAVASIINHGETNMTNGDDDDYSLYFGADHKARIIVHDLDTCFNLNAIGLGDENAPPTVSIYQCTDPTFIDNATLTQMDKFYRNPVTGRKFKAELRHYLNTLFTKAKFDATVDELLDPSWMGTQFNPNGDAIRAHIKSFMDTRRTTIEAFLPTAFTASTALAVQNGYPRSTSATDLGALGGKIDPARTAEVRVNGVRVITNPYGSTGASDNSWSAGTAVTLHPGLNTLLCTAHDESGSVFASQTVSIWYDAAGTSKSGALAASETWSAAGGPYNVTGSVSVPSGITLTIEPGTTVFMASGTGITVASGGRLLAQGTAGSGITFARNPSGTGTWSNVTLNGTSPEPNVLSYVTFDNNGSVAVHGQNGANIECDHLTFKNTAVGYLSFDGCSFMVSDCIFPDGTAGFEPVHGSQGIASGGRGIVQRCAFGKPVGYNDSFDFTGGNRPGPILHVLNCTFAGSEDDMLDLDSTDAWIEGCTFIHCHRNGSSPDSSSGVSGGTDNTNASQVTVVNCLFYDCDNAVTMKQGNQPNGNSAVLLYNTIVHTTKTGGIDTGTGVVNFDDDNVSGEGKGFYLEGNIIWDAESLTRNYDSALSQLTMINNSLPVAAPSTATASGNIVGDPLLKLSLITDPATATMAQIQAALVPQGCSPALHLGAQQGRNALRVQTPPAAWPASVTLSIGPGGSFTPTGQPAWNYGFTHYRSTLDSGAESEDITISTPLALSGLSAGPHTLSIRGRMDSGELQTTPLTLTFLVVPGAPSVALSEILANSTVPDMIELHNWGTTEASLAGCTLSDDSLLPALFAFPATAVIPAGGYLAVSATELGFNLNSSGETVSLYSGASVIDEVTFGQQLLNLSIARTSSGWTLASPTPSAANAGVCELGSGGLLRINEWLGNNDLITGNDFVELYNAEGKPVNLANWRISQDFRNEPLANAFPPLSFIAAGGFMELIADGNRAGGAEHLDFKVSSVHDSVSLLDAAGVLMDHVFVLPGNPDISQGRTTDGGITVSYLALPTPGFSNASDTAADVAVMNSLRISELMFAPPGSGPEFVEFKNIGTTPLTATGVRFDSGISFSFPSLTIPAGGYAVITNSLSAFNTRYPGVTATQWTSGRLDNSGETLRIETGSYGLGILEFRYEGDWYPTTRTGASLEVINPEAARTTWSDAASWQPCVPSPGGPSIFGVLAPLDVTVAPPEPAILSGFICPGAFGIGSISVAWEKVSGPGAVTFTAPANKDTDANFSLPGVYVLRITATPPAGNAVSDTVTVTYGEPLIPIVPGNGTLACNVGSSAKITAASLASLATGGNAPLTVTGVQSALTTTGGRASLQDGWVVYEPAAGVAGLDTFSYTLSDGIQTVSGTVTVVVRVRPGTSVNIAGVAPEAGGIRLGGSAIPGRTYGWQYSSDLLSWTLLGTPEACPANGIVTILDPGPLPPTRYYRLVEFAP